MKLTEKQKVEIYRKRKQGIPVPWLSLEYGMNRSGIQYLVRLIDAHGLDIVKHDYHHYTHEFKLNAINRVLINQESIYSVSIELGISNSGTLPHITRSDYYYWCNHMDSDWKHDDLMNRIITIFYVHKARYGYRRMTLALWNEGIHVNHKLVQRLMNKMGLAGVTPKAKYKSYKG